jgi:hypothetical protein
VSIESITTTAAAHAKMAANLRPFLIKELIRLLLFLDATLVWRRWDLISDELHSLGRLLEFEDHSEYLDFMVDCGFITNIYREKPNTSLLQSVFDIASNRHFRVERAGRKNIKTCLAWSWGQEVTRGRRRSDHSDSEILAVNMSRAVEAATRGHKSQVQLSPYSPARS